MNKVNTISGIILLAVMAGCGGGNRSTTVILSNDGLITVDVSKSYPKKELILQDFMDVEYIPLETTDEFITQGRVRAVGKEFILVQNWVRDGDIFIFDRTTGKGLRKINRRGQGPEEYQNVIGILLDEDHNELFVYEGRIYVYDLNGQFKRSLRNRNEYIEFYNYSPEQLIAYDGTVETQEFAFKKRLSYHAILSKEDGSVIREMSIPYKDKKPTDMVYAKADGSGVLSTNISNISGIIPFQGNWILSQSSADTVYMYLPDDRMLPLIARTPSIQSMDPGVFLFPQVLTAQYYFMRAVKKELKSINDEVKYLSTNLVYDSQEQRMYESVVYNDDFSTKNTIDMSQQKRIGNNIAFWYKYEAFELVEAYEKGELKGGLKEIAATLDAESNPVIMLVTNKND